MLVCIRLVSKQNYDACALCRRFHDVDAKPDETEVQPSESYFVAYPGTFDALPSLLPRWWPKGGGEWKGSGVGNACEGTYDLQDGHSVG